MFPITRKRIVPPFQKFGFASLASYNQYTMAASSNILSADYWKNTEAFLSLEDKMTQKKYYEQNNASQEVLTLVDLESKPFGSVSENIMSELFQMGKRTSSQNDGVRKAKKVETKCARYWSGKDDCRWQHLEPDHDYEVALLCLLDFHRWKVWAIKKSLLMGELRDKKIVTFQGKQGWWVTKNDVLPYLTEINSVGDFDKFLESV